MPFTVYFEAEGVWSWLESHPGAASTARINTIMRSAQKQAFKEWATSPNGSNVGLKLRFSERGFAELQLTPRSKSYQKHQQKYLGKVLPYASPDSKTGTMRGLVLGGGYSITLANNTGTVVKTNMTITGANQLNRLGGKSSIYRQEFLGFDRGGKADAAWIVKRSNEIALANLIAEWNKSERKRLRASAK